MTWTIADQMESNRQNRKAHQQRIGLRRGRWTEEEDRLAIAMFNRGKTSGQTSFCIRRTPDAIAARLRYLGMTRQIVPRKPPGGVAKYVDNSTSASGDFTSAGA